MNYKAGSLVSLTQDDYPGLGGYFVQIWSYGTGPNGGDEVVARVYGETPERAREKAGQLVDSMNYMQAVDDALVIRYLGVASGSAKKDLNKIIDWEINVSLDPAVSSRAEELIQKGRDEVLSQRKNNLTFTECVFSGKAPKGFSDWFQWVNSPTKKGAFIRAVSDADWRYDPPNKPTDN